MKIAAFSVALAVLAAAPVFADGPLANPKQAAGAVKSAQALGKRAAANSAEAKRRARQGEFDGHLAAAQKLFGVDSAEALREKLRAEGRIDGYFSDESDPRARFNERPSMKDGGYYAVDARMMFHTSPQGPGKVVTTTRLWETFDRDPRERLFKITVIRWHLSANGRVIEKLEVHDYAADADFRVQSVEKNAYGRQEISPDSIPYPEKR